MNLSLRAQKNLQSALSGALLGGMITAPRVGAAAAYAALSSFAEGVLPFLFPFSCLTQLLTGGRCVPVLGLRLLGMLGGSPTGARMLAERAQDVRSARRSAMMTGGVSPMFFVGALALQLHSTAAGWVILLAHLLALLLGGWMIRDGQKQRIPLPDVTVPQAVAGSAQAMLSVGGCIALAAMASALAGVFLPQAPRALLHAALEMSGGCQALIALGWPRRLTLCLLSAACAFSGAAILLQNGAYWQKAGVSTLRLAGYGVVRAALAFFAAFVLTGICQACKIAV